MALDHYVSQVHLKQFYSPEMDMRQMFAFQKQTLKVFPCSSESVCRIEENSTTKYLEEPRAIEEFLKGVEPKYNLALCGIREQKLTPEVIFPICGFATYVTTCSPAALRLHATPLKKLIQTSSKVLEKIEGLLPPAPPELGGKKLSDLMESGEVVATVDEKFPQAIGISVLMRRLSLWGNSRWDIITNPHVDSPFFTSDFPVGVERLSSSIVNWIFPLAPDLAIRIRPDAALRDAPIDLSFNKMRYKVYKASRDEVRNINKLSAQCAESLVFFRDKKEWVVPFLSKHRHHYVEAVTQEIPRDTGYLNINSFKIMDRSKVPDKLKCHPCNQSESKGSE